MFFNSFVFFLYLAVVLPVFFALRGQKAKAAWLLIASYFFYGYWDWRFCSLLAISTIVDFIVGARLHRTEDPAGRKRYLLISMIVNLGILAVFKYFNFFISSVESAVAGFGGNVDFLHLNIILPVGISFYTFQTMSYTIDIYRRKLEPTDSFLDFALFVSFFPQLVAGPIERARNLLPQIAQLGNPNRQQIASGLALLANGYFRKVLIGDPAGRIVDQVFHDPTLYRSPELLAGLVLFGVQIYADFSGYSHIARGLSRLLGVDLMRNFEQPYLSANITEFWRRWHISLSSWLRDYLYIALGGNRKGPRRTYVNLAATMLLGGLWHGASWNFVVWGGLHGIYLAVHKAVLGDRKPETRYQWQGPGSLVRYLANVAATNLLVLLAWLFFRAQDFSQAGYFLRSFVQWEGSALAGRWTGLTLAFVAVMMLLDVIEYKTQEHSFLYTRVDHAAAWGIGMAIAATVAMYMATSTPLPFVYFQFGSGEEREDHSQSRRRRPGFRCHHDRLRRLHAALGDPDSDGDEDRPGNRSRLRQGRPRDAIQRRILYRRGERPGILWPGGAEEPGAGRTPRAADRRLFRDGHHPFRTPPLRHPDARGSPGPRRG